VAGWGVGFHAIGSHEKKKESKTFEKQAKNRNTI
jgi:hypothetical protein